MSYSVWEGIKLLDTDLCVLCIYIYLQEFIFCSQHEYLAKFTETIADVVLHERKVENEFMEPCCWYYMTVVISNISD